MLCLCYACSEEKLDPKPAQNKLDTKASAIQLQRLPANETGVTFNNKINDTGGINPFSWNFIYQGAGVGIADFNGDKLPDIYLCGNFVNDKLYLNKGNFKFEDITTQAGLQNKLWSTGVSIADINADGHLDIYVCKNSPHLAGETRANKVYLNNGKAQFVEASQLLGLADTGFSIQANFFDLDNDGDLDLYLVNQPMDAYSRLLISPQQLASITSHDKIYINENGSYKDRTNQFRPRLDTYGLNVLVSDLNRDGYQDLYISNDYESADELLLNQSGKSFKNATSSSLNHLPMFSMGSDAADINKDGLPDLFNLDMSYSDHVRAKTNMKSMQTEDFWRIVKRENNLQYSKNTLQLNQGQTKFSDLSHLAGIESTDWSWAPLFADLNNDGNLELMITNGIYKDMQNNDFREQLINQYKGSIRPDNYLEILKLIPSTPVANYLFQQTSSLKFKDISQTAGFDRPGFSSGMAYGDLDLDGDLDVVINNINDEASILKNTSAQGNYLKVELKGLAKNSFGVGARVELRVGQELLCKEMNPVRGYMSSVEPTLHFGLGQYAKVDEIAVYWNHNKKSILKNIKSNQTISIDAKKAISIHSTTPTKSFFKKVNLVDWVHKENTYDAYGQQILLPYSHSANGPLMTVHDFNKDGLEDIFISGSAGYDNTLMVQKTNGQFQTEKVSKKSKKQEALQSVLFNLDNDNLKELFVTSGGSQYEPNSDLLSPSLFTYAKGGLTLKPTLGYTLEGKIVISSDVDSDGDEDLFVGGYSLSNHYPQAASSRLLINENGILKDKKVNDFEEIAIVSAALFADIDDDGDDDLIVAGQWTPISLFTNDKGRFSKSEIKINGQSSMGLWSAIEAGDFDGDGDLDIIVGNLGQNNKFHPTVDKPLYLYTDDFDANGTYDFVLAKTYKQNIVPVRGKECSTQQMPFINNKVGSYNQFALASLEEIIPISKSSVEKKKITSLSSIYLENKSHRSFEASDLPVEMQRGPIKDFLIKDINNDGHLDIIYGGNHFPVEVETVRYDALGLGLALGDGKGQFTESHSIHSGLLSHDDIRDLDWIDINGVTHLVVSSNSGPLQFYRWNKK